MLYPGILVICVISVYAVNRSTFDLWLLAGFSLLGYAFRKLDVPAAPSPTATPAKPAEGKPAEAAKPAESKPAAPAASPAAAPKAEASPPSASGGPAASPAASPASAAGAPATKPASGPVAGLPDKVEFLVHTGPGGGSDTLARAMIELFKSEKLVEGTWTVNNVSGGGASRAMAYLMNQKGRGDVIAIRLRRTVWISTPLTSKEVQVTVKDVTPISALLRAENIAAVRAESPYKTMKEFIEAAKARPNQINQVGGSLTSSDNLTREALMKETGAKWNYLSFPGLGERVAAILGGTAELWITQPQEASEQIRAGKLRVIASSGKTRVANYPDAPTLIEQGLSAEDFAAPRGIMGPPGMPAERVAAFDMLIRRLSETAVWKEYLVKSSAQLAYMPSVEFKALLDVEVPKHDRIMTELGLKAQ